MSAIGYDLRFALDTIWKVALASLILGAGLPIIFAMGIRSLAWGTAGAVTAGGGTAGGGPAPAAKPNPLGKVVAGVLFLIVAYAIVAGLVYIVATGKGSSYDITFRHVIPEIYKKAS
jgi:hypothetical protein